MKRTELPSPEILAAYKIQNPKKYAQKFGYLEAQVMAAPTQPEVVAEVVAEAAPEIVPDVPSESVQ